MDDQLYLKTGKFEHQNVQENFINQVSFGEDFADWLISETSSLSDEGFVFSDPVMEDYGHGLNVENGKDRFWIAFSFAEEGPTSKPAHWVITVATNDGVFKKLFSKVDEMKYQVLRNKVWSIIRHCPDIQVFTEEEWVNLE
ncbi:MAG: hypothetical protein WD357_05925 [Gracilimonas sp.]